MSSQKIVRGRWVLADAETAVEDGAVEAPAFLVDVERSLVLDDDRLLGVNESAGCRPIAADPPPGQRRLIR